MPFSSTFVSSEPSREEIDQRSAPLMLEFGTDWCGYCRAAQPLIEQAFKQHQEVEHIKIEDGKGRRLGRSFTVKLWPTLVFMKDGKEVARVVRPESSEEIGQALGRIA